MNEIKTIMNAENAVFGTRKNGKAHSAISGTRAYQRRIQREVQESRRHLLTGLQQAATKEEVLAMINASQDTKDVMKILEAWANRGVDMRHRISELAGNMDAARRYVQNPKRFVAIMTKELESKGPGVQRELAKAMMRYRQDPSKITIQSVLEGMGHTTEEAQLMQAVAERMSQGKEIDLFGISRYFSSGNMGRIEFIKHHGMSRKEIQLSDELRTYIDEAMRVPKNLTEAEIKQSLDVYLKTILPEIPRFVENGFDINHRTITRYFGKHNEFLHRRMVSGDLNIYVNDPGYSCMEDVPR